MDAEDRHVLEVLGHLSHKIPTRALLRLYTLKRSRKDFFGMYFFKNFLYNKRFLTLLNVLLTFRFDGGN